MADAYDFWANRLTKTETELIDGFWEKFAQAAPRLDQAFRGLQLRIDTEREMYNALGNLWNVLFWEFSHGETGGWHLALSADYYHERRAFARAAINRAPELAGWTFSDTRPPTRDPVAARDTILTRARVATLSVERIEPRRGAHRLVELIATGSGSPGQVAGEAGVAFSVLLGDAADQDWLGDCTGRARDTGLTERLNGRRNEPPDVAWLGGVRDQALEIIAGFESDRPQTPFWASRMEGSETSDFQLQPAPDTTIRRHDAITWTTRYRPLAAARMAGVKITSLRYSRHGESFCGLKVARTPHHPFDTAAERRKLADRLEELLVEREIGGVTGSGHGLEHIYVDLALTDVQRSLGTLRQALAERQIDGPAWLIFDEAGLEDRTVALTSSTPAEPEQRPF